MSEQITAEIQSIDVRDQLFRQIASVANKLLATRVATEKQIFDRQNAPDTRDRLQFQGNNPEAFVEKFWKDKLIDFLVSCTTFGSYCHEGGDLVRDFMDYWQIEINYDALEPILTHIAGEVIEKYEATHCSYCNDELSEGES